MDTIYDQFILNFFNVIKNGIGGVSIIEIFIFLIFSIISISVRSVFANFLVKKISIFIEKTTNKKDDIIFDALVGPLKLLPVIIIFIYIGFYEVSGHNFFLFINKINQSLMSVFIFWIFYSSIAIFFQTFSGFEKFFSKALSNWTVNGVKYLIILLGIVAILEVWGIKIGPVIAGLGLFGVAVALGAQDLFKNLISGIMIILERRFNIGDIICLPNYAEGTVEHIGFRSTVIRQFDSSPISIPNHLFAEAPLLNFSNRHFRRINWIVGLEYSSTVDKIKNLTNSIKYYIENNQNFTVDENYKMYVYLEKFNDSSIDLLIYCFSSTNDWNEFLKIKEDLAYHVKKEVEKNGLNFAYPSRSIYIEKSN